MDTKAIEYFTIPGDTISYPVYSQDGIPGFYDGTDIIRWPYEITPNTLYRVNLTPTAGS